MGMMSLRRLWNSTLIAALILPLVMIVRSSGNEDWVLADAIPPTGEAAALLMFAAMAIGPLARIFGVRQALDAVGDAEKAMDRRRGVLLCRAAPCALPR
jgi:hypothetical protein